MTRLFAILTLSFIMIMSASCKEEPVYPLPVDDPVEEPGGQDPDPEPEPADDGVLKILSIGNSFSDDALLEHLWELGDAAGVDMVIGIMYIGGSALSQHLANTGNDAPSYTYRKNVDGIIRKFAKFHKIKGYEDIRLIIAGRGEEENNLKALTAELGLQDYVDFVGFLPQAKLNECIRNSYAFLVNTRKDLNMVSIPEAIVSGTPILTNLQPASADYITANSLGIAKDNWDERDMKAIIDDNMRFVKNCVAYREKLTNVFSAKLFIDEFQNKK